METKYIFTVPTVHFCINTHNKKVEKQQTNIKQKDKEKCHCKVIIPANII